MIRSSIVFSQFNDAKFRQNILSWILFTLAFLPFCFFTFLNVDPLHDGWFATPATALVDGAMPYRDVVTSYGWFTPAFLAAIIKIFGFQLVYFRLVGLFLLIGICCLLIQIGRKSLDINKVLVIVSIWLLIGLGQMTKDPGVLPSWGLWPNQFIIFGTLFLIYLLLRQTSFSYITVSIIGLIAGITPWIRAQGILIFGSALFVFTIRIYQSIDINKYRKIFYLFFISIMVFSLPFLCLLLNGAMDEWFWQTIEMPRSGEWFGMPDPAVWILQNFGLSVVLTFGLFLFSFISGLLGMSLRNVVFLLAPILLLISMFPIPKAQPADSIIVRKIHSLLFLYSNYHFFTLPILITLSATLIVIAKILLATFVDRGRNLVELPTLIAFLGIPPLTLVYYNFGHLWGVAPLLLLTVLHYSKFEGESSSRFSRIGQVVVVYSVIVSLIAIPQIYSKIAKPTFAYSVSGLAGLNGQDSQQVFEVRNAIQSLSRLPKDNLVFFLCKDAFYSTFGGKYLSDNLFYSSSMTVFDRRSRQNRAPSPETNFVVYCPGSNTISIEQLPETWVLSDFNGNDSSSGLQIYERR